ncbi:MAG: DUF420 domain-containing protein [Planctomycetes bacterium]|nr:DUF420 domain-containing protein [Planctomycetota bacterium]
MAWVESLPPLNAFLNAVSATLVVLGYLAIRRRNVARHRVLMLSAVVVSALFLVSYLTHYFASGGPTRFTKEGWIRPVYFTILFSHTVLAVVVVPLVLVTLRHALKDRLDRHRRIARITLPIWAYVSITGVVIYFLLRH